MSRGLTSHSTLYRSFRGRFLQVRWPNQQCKSTERSLLADEIGFNSTRTTPPCYSMNCRQPPLGWSQRKGPSVTITQSAGPISCLEHNTTRVLHCTIVNTAAVLMLALSLQSIISNQMRPRRLRGVWFNRLLRHPARRPSGSILSPGTHTADRSLHSASHAFDAAE